MASLVVIVLSSEKVGSDHAPARSSLLVLP
jgi:hypothetical protein